MLHTKNSTVCITTVSGFDSGFLKPITKVRTMMPITSSIIAALVMSVPTCSLMCPSSLSVCTVMPTDVAVSIVPIKIAL